MKTVICYKTKTPMYGDDKFLAYYTYKTVRDAQIEAEQLNAEKPARLITGAPINWDLVDYFYASEQEEMW